MTSQIIGVSPKALLYRIRKGEKFTLIDVRTEEESAAWRFEFIDDQLNIPYIEFIEEPEQAIAMVPKGKTIVTLCAKGGASAYVANLLAEKGHPAMNVTGGMKEFGKLYTKTSIMADHEKEVIQFNRLGKGCLSYLLVSGSEAAIIDPGRHIDYYLDYLFDHDLSLRWIFDTHLHADHLSGATALAEATGATYYANGEDMVGAKIRYMPLCEGEYCMLGRSRIKAVSLKSPGHTPGSTVIIFDDSIMFTGDTLFLSSMGRPDLGGKAAEWAVDLWKTVRALDDYHADTLILPGHSAGKRELDENWQVKATLGALRNTNQLLSLASEEKFIEETLASLPEEPSTYQTMRKVNLGVESLDDEGRDTVELGRNRCAMEQVA